MTKKEKALSILISIALVLVMATSVVFADPGLREGWVEGQIKLIFLIAVGIAVLMCFIRKDYSKLFIVFIAAAIGGYMIYQPSGLQNVGQGILSLFGL